MSDKQSSKKSYWLLVPLGLLKSVRWVLGALFNRYTMTLVVSLFLFDIWCEWRGIPEFASEAIRRAITSRKLPMTVGWIQAGFLRGVVLSDVTMQVNSAVGPVEIHASSVEVSLDWSSLLEGKLLPHSFRAKGASVVCSDDDGKYVVRLNEMELESRIEGDGSLFLSVVGDCSGLDFDVDMRLYHGREGFQKLLERSSGENIVLNRPLQEWLVRFHDKMSEVLSRGGGSCVRMSVNGDCFQPKQWIYQGYAIIQDAYIQDLDVIRGSFSFSGMYSRMILHKLRLAIGTANAIRGKMILYGEKREYEANLTSQLEARTLNNLMTFFSSLDVAVLDKAILALSSSMERPIGIDIQVQRCLMSIEDLSANIQCNMPSVNIPLLGRCRGIMKLSYADNILKLDTAKLVLARNSSEKVAISGTWNLKSQEVDVSLDGDLDIQASLSAAGVRLPESLLRFGESVSHITAICKFPLATPANISASGNLTASGVSVLGTLCETMTCKGELLPGNNINLSLRGARAGKYEMVSLDSSIDMQRWKNSNELLFGIHSLRLHGTRPSEPISATGEALSCTGEMLWKASEGTVSFNLDGSCYPGRLYHSYLQRYNFDRSGMLKHIDCSGDGEAMRFNMTLPEQKLNSGSWELQGALSFGRMRFNGFPFNSLKCNRFSVTSNACEFNDIRVESAGGDVGRLDLRVDFSQDVNLTFSRVKIEGDPRIVGAFLVYVPVRDAFLRVFQGIQWKSNERPVIQIPQLVYHCGDFWRVVSEGIYVQARNVAYSQLEVDEVNAIIALDLPSRMVAERVMVSKNNCRIAGSVDLRLGDAPQCDFRIYKTLYGIDLCNLLSSLFPDKAKLLNTLSVSNDCLVDCSGSVFLSGKPRLFMRGGLHSKYIKYGEWQLDDVVSTWTYDDGDIRWHIEKSNLLDGEFKSSGNYDIGHDQGQFLVRFDGLSLDKATKIIRGKNATAATYTGKVNGELQLAILRGWAGRDWHLNGNGRMSVREGELWNVPLLSSLGKLVSSATFGVFSNGLGQISELDAEFELLGERVNLSRLSTNGTIVSLEGNGSYYWKDTWRQGQLKLLVNGVPVKGIKLLSFMLTPLTGMFQAELSGTLDENSWKMRTFVDKLF